MYYFVVLYVQSQTWVAQNENQGISRTACLSGSSRRKNFSLLFQLLETTCIPWLLAPFLYLQRRHWRDLVFPYYHLVFREPDKDCSFKGLSGFKWLDWVHLGNPVYSISDSADKQPQWHLPPWFSVAIQGNSHRC